METIILNHPLIKHKMVKLRDKTTGTKEFRESVNEIAGLMSYEATKDLELKPVEVETPIQMAKGEVLAQNVVIIPVMRAGLGMVDMIQNLIPTAKVGHIGLFRNEVTFVPEEYYTKLPDDLGNATILLLDPMLATGGTVKVSYDILKKHGAKDIRYLGIVGVQEGLDYLEAHCPDMKVYLAVKDDRLNENKYIVPGLGDAGDRLFGTK
ncbi:MAG: uracil phosphoribosyltransferase [Bacillota bacterium]